MPIINPGPPMQFAIDSARSLADDLERGLRDRRPTVPTPGGAPRRDLWQLATRPLPIPMGRVSKHPVLDGDLQKSTSDILCLVPQSVWARTSPGFDRHSRSPLFVDRLQYLLRERLQ